MFFSKKKPESAPAANTSAPGRNLPELQGFLKRLFLVLDGSAAAQKAAEFAVKLAALTGAELHAAFIVDTATMEYLTQMHILVQEEREELEADQLQRGLRHLERLQELGKSYGLDIQAVTAKGRLHQTALLLARQQQTDAIIIAGWKARKNHTPSAERQLIMELAEIPVFVVKNGPVED